MRAARLRSQIRRRFRPLSLTDSNHDLPIAPNRLRDMATPVRRDAVWVADITYVNTHEGWLYVAAVVDRWTRRCVGWAMSESLATALPLAALNMALEQRHPPTGLIHHSDRGLQYASSVYQKGLRDNRIMPSMTDGADCYQNALAERVNGILKQEFLTTRCQNGQELKLLIEESIDIYNNERPHLSLGMKTPNAVHEKACELKLAGLDC